MESTKDEYKIVGAQSYPWLLIQDRKDLKRQTFCSLSQHRFYPKSIDAMKNKIIATCSFNWLVLLDWEKNSQVCYLLNLVTLDKVHLPLLDIDLETTHLDRSVCVLSSPPNEPDCLVLFFFDDFLLFCRIGDGKYTKQELDYSISDATVFQGKVWCITRRGQQLVTVEFVSGFPTFNLVMNEFSTAYPPEMLTSKEYLMQFDGELLLLCLMRSGVDSREICGFRVFQMNFDEKTWVRVHSIGEKTIFLSQSNVAGSYGLYCEAQEEKVKKNCIYITRPYDKCIYIFSLADLSISTQQPCPIVGGEDMFSSWVMIS